MLIHFATALRSTASVHRLQKKLMDLKMYLADLSEYSGLLGGTAMTSISGLNLASVPHKLFSRASVFSQYADQASSMSASQNLMQMKMLGRMPIANNPQQQYMMELSAFTRFKEEAMKALKQQEVNWLNAREKEIQLEVTSIEHELKIQEGMLNASKEKALSDAEKEAPKF